MKKTSIKEQLATSAKRLGLRMPQAQLLLAQERFLARIAKLDRKQSLIWKGGSLVLRRYSTLEQPRFTTDIDFTAKGIEMSEAEELILAARDVDLNDDFAFGASTKSEMERDTPYGGFRYEIQWTLNGTKNSEPLRIDLCAGDDVDPEKIDLNEVYLIEDESGKISISVYPAEFIFAEKLETMARFETGNTRLKDFIDMWGLTRLDTKNFQPKKCASAIKRCFSRRGTKLDLEALVAILLDADFQEIMEEARLRNFSKLSLPTVPEMFQAIAEFIKRLKF